MGAGKIAFRAGLVIILVIFVLNLLFYASIYGTGTSLLYPAGITKMQMLMGNIGYLSSIIANSSTRQISLITIGAEFVLIILMMAIAAIKRRIRTKREYGTSTIHSHLLNPRSKTETEIDVLYRLLQSRKTMKLSAAVKIFKAEQDTIIEWCKILENANLATLSYPKVGEPEMAVIEKEAK
jgi:hypothetical protein